MAAHASDLTTIAKVKANLSISDSSSDALLQELVTSLSGYIVNFLNREIKSASRSDKLDGLGRNRIRLRHYPITAISSVSIGGVAVQASADGLRNGYVFDDKYLYLLDGTNPSVFASGIKNVSVSYTAGYSDVPFDIDRICVEMVSKRYKDRQRIGLTSEGIQGQSTGFSQYDMTRDTMRVLDNYRRVVP